MRPEPEIATGWLLLVRHARTRQWWVMIDCETAVPLLLVDELQALEIARDLRATGGVDATQPLEVRIPADARRTSDWESVSERSRAISERVIATQAAHPPRTVGWIVIGPTGAHGLWTVGTLDGFPACYMAREDAEEYRRALERAGETAFLWEVIHRGDGGRTWKH
jgi:hypothetical protein